MSREPADLEDSTHGEIPVTPPTRKKLIEVALPLEAINQASGREKAIRYGNPSTLHLWWARRPLAAARAVIFAQMVDDPSSRPELFPTQKDQDQERQRLFWLLEALVKWKNTDNQQLLSQARAEIAESWRRTCADNANHPRAAELFDHQRLPAFHDPFAGGGALPLEAQRLGMAAHASDLNPVAVLINKAMIEIPPKFAGQAPVNPERREKMVQEPQLAQWLGATGLADDVQYYGRLMRDEAEKQIGHLYPSMHVTPQVVQERPELEPYAGRQLAVIAWFWARTIPSPNPAFSGVGVPLVSTFQLSKKSGKAAYVQPIVSRDGYRFVVRSGVPTTHIQAVRAGTKLGRGTNFRCLMSGVPIPSTYVRSEATAGRMGARLMAVVVEGDRERLYLSPTPDQEEAALHVASSWKPDLPIPDNIQAYSPQIYGFPTFGDLFTPRQAVALTTFQDLVGDMRERVRKDAAAAGLSDDGKRVRQGGTGATAYSEAVGTYLALATSRAADYWSAFATWHNGRDVVRNSFPRQALRMAWDYAESNPFSNSTGNWLGACLMWIVRAIRKFPASHLGNAWQDDARCQTRTAGMIVSTDPPYYDNVDYADLSDFFYVWLRRALKDVWPAIFGTLEVPKSDELVAAPYRHGGKKQAEVWFMDGMLSALRQLSAQAHPGVPVTIYYAFKQAESKGAKGMVSTGWETFLTSVVKAGFAITGTWPIRTELRTRTIAIGTNALASSIVLVCRRRPSHAPVATRQAFRSALRAELPIAIRALQTGNIAPVDMAQAAIGPGMAVYSRNDRVIYPDGELVEVREALHLINEVLDETLSKQEGDFDSETRWALTWFGSQGLGEGDYGVADVLAKARNTDVRRLVEVGVADSSAGKVRLLRPEELPADWRPASGRRRVTAWEAVHHLVRTLHSEGEEGSAQVMANLGTVAGQARDLAYRLYGICERNKWTEEAGWYNGLVASWSEVELLAAQVVKSVVSQEELEL